MKKSDFLILLGTILIGCFLIFIINISKKEAKKVVVYVNGEIYKTHELENDARIVINERNVLEIKNSEAFMSYADCPDKLCIKQGKIKDMTKSIICLPNKVAVKIEE